MKACDWFVEAISLPASYTITTRPIFFRHGWAHHFCDSYENDFTLIGTTDQDHLDPNAPVECTAEEQAYLLKFASQYFETQ